MVNTVSRDELILMAQEMDRLDVRIRRLENDNAEIKEAIDKICKVWFPQLVSNIKELKALSAQIPKAAVITPQPPVMARIETSYSTWCEIQRLKEERGRSDMSISRTLGIPYSTVRKYRSWTKDVVEKKRITQYQNNPPEKMLQIERQVFND